MEFGIENVLMLVMKSGKRHMTDGMELPNQDKIRTLGEKETYLASWRLTPSNKWRLRKIKKEYQENWKAIRAKTVS